MKKSKIDDFIINIVIAVVIILAICLIYYVISKPEKPRGNFAQLEAKARMDSASAVYYMGKADSLKLIADSLIDVAKHEYKLRLASDKALYDVKKKQSLAAPPQEAVIAFLKATDSCFNEPSPSGIYRSGDTLFEISVMNIRSANWLFTDLEEERSMTNALLDYQEALLNAYDTLYMAADKSAISSLKWELAYGSLSNVNAILKEDKAALLKKNKKIKIWAWISTGMAGAAIFSAFL
jgi:hypothetical protein